jgi:aminoglycoside 3-N-acetyltransferase I
VASSTDFQILIRRLGEDGLCDMRSMLRCFGDAFDDEATYTDQQPGDAYLGELLGDPSFVALGAIVGGRVVGGLVAYELRKFERERSEFYIYDLAVLAEFRRRGIATALVEALKPIARASGGWVIFVQADAVDAPALTLYDRLGIREDGVFHFRHSCRLTSSPAPTPADAYPRELDRPSRRRRTGTVLHGPRLAARQRPSSPVKEAGGA